jgi:glycosyltransferase involved in cell wall biosynthesis
MVKIFKKKIGILKNILVKLIKGEKFIPYKGLKKTDLLIFDNIFPHPVSGFRYEEFAVLLSSFRNSKIIMSSSAYSVVNTSVKDHKNHIKDFIKQNKSLKNKLKLRKGFVNVNAKLFYCVFISNVFNNLNWLEKHEIPFVFTLYPGGGFQLNEILSDNKLKKVFASPMFRKVIVTQKITYDYLINNNFCKSDDIQFIFGGVVPQISLDKDLTNKKSYLINKATFDICFCAAKYTPKGVDKGYDVFIDFAHMIAKEYDFIRFHIVGGFAEDEIDVSAIKDRIHFYGYQNFESLGAIYKNMDVLISPNKPFVLGKGAFDGFPLGTVVEAVLNGVVVLITDELKQNNIFISDVDLILIKSEIYSIKKEIIDLIDFPEKLYSISEKGKEKFLEVYSNKIQMLPRTILLQNEISKNN